MKNRWFAVWPLILLFGVLISGAEAIRSASSTFRPDLPPLTPITKEDRILILAPHEDDETLGAGGLIQRALTTGATVRVIYLTYGDHNEWAFLAYRKNPILTPKINKEMGELRRREAERATQHLGLAAVQRVFLGFPDNGTLDIWKKHWRDEPPLLSILTDTRSVPYLDAVAYGRPYKGEEILAALEKQLLNFRPTRVVVTHPADGNPDHRAYNLFLEAALLDLQGKIAPPTVLCYPIHMGPWPRPLAYHPDRWLLYPKILQDDPSPGWSFELRPEETLRKAEAIRMYKSQMADHGYWLVSLARRNELFMSPEPIRLETDRWSPGHGVYPRPVGPEQPLPATPDHIDQVTYRGADEGLMVQIRLRFALQRELGVSCYVFGYRNGQAFAAMPKLHMLWSFGRLAIDEQGKRISLSGIHAEENAKILTFTIPWEDLGDPRVIFIQVRGLAGGLPVSYTAWQRLQRP